jgi:hypothetical protein
VHVENPLAVRLVRAGELPLRSHRLGLRVVAEEAATTLQPLDEKGQRLTLDLPLPLLVVGATFHPALRQAPYVPDAGARG